MPIVEIILARSREASLAAGSRDPSPRPSKSPCLPIPPTQDWRRFSQAVTTETTSSESSYGEELPRRYNFGVALRKANPSSQVRSQTYSTVIEDGQTDNRDVKPRESLQREELVERAPDWLRFRNQLRNFDISEVVRRLSLVDYTVVDADDSPLQPTNGSNHSHTPTNLLRRALSRGRSTQVKPLDKVPRRARTISTPRRPKTTRPQSNSMFPLQEFDQVTPGPNECAPTHRLILHVDAPTSKGILLEGVEMLVDVRVLAAAYPGLVPLRVLCLQAKPLPFIPCREGGDHRCSMCSWMNVGTNGLVVGTREDLPAILLQVRSLGSMPELITFLHTWDTYLLFKTILPVWAYDDLLCIILRYFQEVYDGGKGRLEYIIREKIDWADAHPPMCECRACSEKYVDVWKRKVGVSWFSKSGGSAQMTDLKREQLEVSEKLSATVPYLDILRDCAALSALRSHLVDLLDRADVGRADEKENHKNETEIIKLARFLEVPVEQLEKTIVLCVTRTAGRAAHPGRLVSRFSDESGQLAKKAKTSNGKTRAWKKFMVWRRKKSNDERRTVGKRKFWRVGRVFRFERRNRREDACEPVIWA